MANYKVCLDAGHYGKYNRSPAVPTYYESDMNWKLHLLLKKYLEDYGIEVITTRKNQATDLALKSRGLASKGCNLFISIHSNAVGSYVKESVDFVTAYHLTDDTTTGIDEKSKSLAQKIAPVISKVMGVSQEPMVLSRKSVNDRNGDGIMNDNHYGVLNGARLAGTPGLILEHSFHTNTRSTLWLMDDNNLDYLAREEAKTIAEWLGIKPYQKGDVNLDGSVSIGDVTELNNILAGNKESTVMADVNGDGKISVADTTELLNILGGTTTTSKPAAPILSTPKPTTSTSTSTSTEKIITVELPQIRKGSKREEVKTLQRLLNVLGYRDKNGKELVVDGDFGTNTDYAVRNFQDAEGLVVDGIVGKDTWRKLLC